MSHVEESAAPEPAVEKKRGSRGKGIIAIVAGAALLVGGASTYAYWSTQQALTGTVQSGNLNLGLGTPAWTLDGVLTAPTPVTTLANVRVVPGDVLTLAQPVNVTLVGDTIQGLLSVNLGTAIPPAAAGAFTVALTTNVGTLDGANTYRLTPAQAAAPIEATLTITFNPATINRDQVNTTIDLSQISFTLTQASS